MAHGADRIADLVRDAGAEPAERGELRLLDRSASSVVSSRKITTPGAGFAAERREMRPDHARRRRPSMKASTATRRSCAGAGARSRADTAAAARLRRAARRVGAAVAEHLRRGLVDEPDAVLRVDDQDALAQVLHDVLRELRQVREVDLLPAHQRFAFAQTVRERPHEQRDDEEDGAEHPGGRVVGLRRRPPAAARPSAATGARAPRSRRAGTRRGCRSTSQRADRRRAGCRGRSRCRRSHGSGARSRRDRRAELHEVAPRG